jgi:dipeptide transport system ATP-binding protein
MSLLEARALRLQYRVGSQFFGRRTVTAVDGVSFSLEPGMTVAVVGESGCGKSSLARLACLLETPTDGALLIDGAPTIGASGKGLLNLRRTVQMVFQNPYGSLNPRKTIGSILGEPLAIHGIGSKAERIGAARAILDKVGLRQDQLDRYPHMFSGGQRQRIAIARALMLRPRLVIADEPISALDVSVQAQILNLMMDLQDEFGLAYLFISHDLAVVRHIAASVLVMYLGRVVEQGPVGSIFDEPHHPYTQSLLQSTPSAHRSGTATRLRGEPPSPLAPPSGCAFHTRCPIATDLCAQSRPELRILGDALVACHHAAA